MTSILKIIYFWNQEEEDWRSDPDYLYSLEKLSCVECGRSQPNKLRMHAHLQMHRQARTKSKQPPASTANPTKIKSDLTTDDHEGDYYYIYFQMIRIN